jgi:hypothetical protein
MTEKQRSPFDMFGLFADWATQFEQAGNREGNRTMQSAEFSRLMNEALAASTGAQRVAFEARRRFYEMFDVASHSDIVAVQERLAAIDEKLHTIADVLSRLDPLATGTATPARPRTRKPPPEPIAQPSPAATAPAPTAALAPGAAADSAAASTPDPANASQRAARSRR